MNKDINTNLPNILPNLVYCLKTGKYNEKYNQEVEEEVSKEYDITKEVLRMAAVRCCFNCKKTDILHDLLLDYDLNKLETEIKCMEDSGLFIIDMDKTCRIANGYDITEVHDFFYNNKNIDFFNYCNDYLTSWDACNLVYRNDFPPSLLAQYACIAQAEEPASLVQAVLASIGKVKWEVKGKKLTRCGISACITGNSCRKDVREFLKENNYDFDLAQKKFNWIRQYKYFYKKSIKEEKKHIRMVRKYPVLVGIPLIVKASGQASYFKFIDLNEENVKGQDFNKLVEKVLDIQKKAIIQYENNKLNKVAIEIINQELAECYDMLLYLYISEAESIIDYNKGWTEKYKDKIIDKLGQLGILGQVKEIWLFKDVISTMFLSNNVEKCLYKINGWTDLLIDNNDNISIKQVI